MHVRLIVAALTFSAPAFAVKEKRDVDSTFNLYQGTDTQESVANEPAADLEYTLSSGNP